MKLDLSKELDKKRATVYFNRLLEEGRKVEIKRLYDSRTLPQNRYLHVVISFFCMETGYTIEEAKQLLYNNFGSFMVYEKNGVVFTRSSSDLTTQEMTELIEWIRNVACFENLGVYVPTPEEYITMQFEVEQYIEQVK